MQGCRDARMRPRRRRAHDDEDYDTQQLDMNKSWDTDGWTDERISGYTGAGSRIGNMNMGGELGQAKDGRHGDNGGRMRDQIAVKEKSFFHQIVNVVALFGVYM